jgi:hypothetical protein
MPVPTGLGRERNRSVPGLAGSKRVPAAFTRERAGITHDR